MAKNASEHCCKGRPREFNRDKALDAALRLFWEEGYEPASIARLCQVMNINPPSLYASFGNKATLFLEAVRHYEKCYWEKPAARFMAEPDINLAVENFFHEAAGILLLPQMPRGSLLVLGAVNIASSETEIITAIKEMRDATRAMFAEKLRRAVAEGQLPPAANVPVLAGALAAFLEGLSMQARNGLSRSELSDIASLAVRLLSLSASTKNDPGQKASLPGLDIYLSSDK